MRKSTPVRRRTLFVFLPPFLALIVGALLIIQASFAEVAEPTLEESERELSGSSERFKFGVLAADLPSSLWVVVNKSRPLPANLVPADLRIVAASEFLQNPRKLQLADAAATALEELATKMSQAGAGVIFINSAYRSFEYQEELFKQKTKQYGLELALVKSAKAGYSEHQTGLAVDVSVPSQKCVILECFGNTIAGKWLAKNSWQFGFIIRYEKGETNITGYAYEPWHLRFIDKEMAQAYYEGGFRTLEEFWDLPPAPTYPEN